MVAERWTEISRRDFIAGSLVVLVASTTKSSSLAALGSGAVPILIRLRRPKDALSIEIEFQNARLKGWRRSRIVPAIPGQPLVAIVLFPSQHVNEEAFLETILKEPPGAIPVWSEAAGQSRLCFDLPSDGTKISIEHLLDWTRWRPRLVADVVSAGDVVQPNETMTAIEMPHRLVLSNGEGTTWLHSPTPITRRGRTEIWHSRLVSDNGRRPVIRAIWSPDYVAGASQVPPPYEKVLSPLVSQHRNGFVHITHVAGFDPEPIEVDVLALSSSGGWLAFEKRWSESQKRRGYPISWKQRTSLARDTRVEVEYLAFLYPFGFKVSVVETTERKVEDAPGNGEAAFLRKHFTIKFEDRFRDYDDWQLPYSRLIPGRVETPYLDFPLSIDLAGGKPDWRQGAFWPMRGGKPYEFEFAAIDRNGRESIFTAPAICVPLTNLAAGSADPRLPVVQNEYRKHTERSTRLYFGQSVGFAPELSRMGTSHPVHQIVFDAQLVPRPDAPAILSPFEPICTSVQLSSSVGKALGGSEADNLAWFVPADPSATPTEVYLLSDPVRGGVLELSFAGKSNRSGGIAAPAMSIGGFARETGPFGAQPASDKKMAAVPASYLSGRFDPVDYLGGDASILGVKLSSVLAVVTNDAARAAPKILTIFSPNPDATPRLSQSFDWFTENLKDAPKLGIIEPILLTRQGGTGRVPDPTSPTRFSLRATTEFDVLGTGEPRFVASGRLSNFTIQLAVEIAGQPNGVVLKVSEAWFMSQAGEKTKFGLELQSVELIGPILSFIQQLQEALAPSLSHAKQIIDVAPDGVKVSLPPLILPPIALGALDVTGVRIASSVSLPFVKRPPSFTFDFSSPDAPFIVAVGIFGGGGFVSLTLDTEGIQSLSAMFQFGGYRALELGVVRGRVFLFGGVYFSSTRLADGPGSVLVLRAFIHCGGEATVFRIVTVGVDFYVSLTYQSNTSNLIGRARLTYSIKVGFFRRKATVYYEHVIQGSKSSRKVAKLGGQEVSNLLGERGVASPVDYLTRAEWLEYRQAFA